MSNPDAIGYPLLLQPCLDEKVWGGQRLETLLGKAAFGGVIGESLETCDDAVVSNGRLAGKTLGELARLHPRAMLGTRGMAASQPYGDFPLLVKFIDATDILSLQVHPDDEGAAHLGKRGKTEAWHIIDADPGAELIIGVDPGTTGEQLRSAIATKSVDTLILRRPVQAGDTLIVRAGTIHAITGGVLLYEIQQNSDVTYRLYDWDRVDQLGKARELHLDEALQAMTPGLQATLVEPIALDDTRSILTACRYFAVERWAADHDYDVPGLDGQSFRVMSCLSSTAELSAGGVELTLARGQTVLLPADVSSCRIGAGGRFLCSWIADLSADIAQPLLAGGREPREITLLGGGTSDLLGAVASAQRERVLTAGDAPNGDRESKVSPASNGREAVR